MPQLNLDPWFMTLTVTWLMYAMILQPKIYSYLPTNSPVNESINTTHMDPWTWPWT